MSKHPCKTFDDKVKKFVEENGLLNYKYCRSLSDGDMLYVKIVRFKPEDWKNSPEAKELKEVFNES